MNLSSHQMDCSVYRIYSDAGKLLYVGISIRLFERLMEHRSTKSWWNTVSRIDLQHFNSIEKALIEEAKAIATENPIHNIAESPNLSLKRSRETIVRNAINNNARQWIDTEVGEVDFIPQKEAADIVGCVPKTLHSWSSMGIAPKCHRLLNGRRGYDRNEINAFKAALDAHQVFNS